VALEKGRVFVSIDSTRDDELVAEGLVRDIARRLQALRKSRGFVPTDVLGKAAVAGLEEEEIGQLEPRKKDLAFLVRVKSVILMKDKSGNFEWAEEDLDGRPLFLDVA
jgi:isoleucyl-tRNA synthetase